MSRTEVAIIGAGPYGLSIAAHLSARGIGNRIFGRPMQFWSQVAAAADRRFLKSYCFGTNLSSPVPGFSFADYNTPRGLETFEPCSMANFAAYGQWFQQQQVPWLEATDVVSVERQHGDGFALTLVTGEHLVAGRVIVATGLTGLADMPKPLLALPGRLATHTADVTDFSLFAGRTVAVIGAGQSALEACALLHEAGAQPTLLVRDQAIRWHTRVPLERSLWRRLRSPLTGLGTGPKAWALTRFPGAMHRVPRSLRSRFVKHHLPAEGAWWLRERVQGRFPIHLHTEVSEARELAGGVALTLRDLHHPGNERARELVVDHVLAGSGYAVDVEALHFLERSLRAEMARVERSPALNAVFESSIPGLHLVGALSAMSFGPMFRFVVGAEYTARVLADHVAKQRLAVAEDGIGSTRLGRVAAKAV